MLFTPSLQRSRSRIQVISAAGEQEKFANLGVGILSQNPGWCSRSFKVYYVFHMSVSNFPREAAAGDAFTLLKVQKFW